MITEAKKTRLILQKYNYYINFPILSLSSVYVFKMHINTSINKSKKPRGRPKKAKVVQASAASYWQPTDKSFFSHASMEEIEVITPIVTSKNENPNKSSTNKKPLQNENWTKRKCLCCSKIFDSWGIGNRLCQGCK